MGGNGCRKECPALSAAGSYTGGIYTSGSPSRSVLAGSLSHDREWRLKRIRHYYGEMFDLLDPCSRRTRSNGRFEPRQRVGISRRGELHVPITSVFDPSGESKLASFVDDVPTESYALNSTPHLEMDALHFAAIA
jgi:hypothetical protein